MLKRVQKQLADIAERIETARADIETVCMSETLKDDELEALGDAQEAMALALEKLSATVPAITA